MSIRIIFLIISMLNAAKAFAWSPYDVEQAKALMVSASRPPVDHLVPSDETRNGNEVCLASYRSEPSFAIAGRWCLQYIDKQYALRSWLSKTTDAAGVPNISDQEASMQIPDELAQHILDVWLNALFQTRYADYPLSGLDGERHYFSVTAPGTNLYMQASTWSPSHDLPPSWLVECGKSVLKFSRESTANSEALNKELLAHKQRLFSYYQKHGLH